MGTPPPIQLGSIGMADSLILMVLALVVFGPRRLPQIGRQIGKLMYEFRKASNDFKFQMEEELRVSEEADRRKKEEAQRQQLTAGQPAQESVSATPAVASSVTGEPASDAAAPSPPQRRRPKPQSHASCRRRPAKPSPPRAGSRTGREVRAGRVTDAKDDPATRNDDAPATEAVSHNG